MSNKEPVALAREVEIDLIDLIRQAWAYKHLILVVTTCCAIAALAYALVARPIYRAEVVVTEVRDVGMSGLGTLAGQLGGLASLAGVNLSIADGAEREAQAVLRSRRLVEEFVRRNELVPLLLSNSRKSPTIWRAVERFRKKVLMIREDRRNGTIIVAIDWSDPVVAARWANGFVVLANELNRVRALDDATRNIAFLNEQIAKTNVVGVQRVMYQLIETETKTLMLASGRTEYAFTIVDPAVPPELRTSPQRTLIVMGGALLGLLLGGFAAFLRHMATQRQWGTPAQHADAQGHRHA
jgi:uncharacterized protein involved in exopolysaccharide biosynthesis